MPTKKQLSPQQTTELIATLKARFTTNRHRHDSLEWSNVENALLAHPTKLYSLHQMEATGGEPDVVAYNPQTGTYTFFDCCVETPTGRRSLCYDEAALASRKANKPAGSAEGMARQMGITMLNEAQYVYLQTLGDFDFKSSSWVLTPQDVRALGGALFGDKRYARTFIYHNGAESYYASRGFRGALEV